MISKSAKFILESETPWEDLGSGISRQIMGYNDQIMMVKVKFEKGAIGYEHHHFHSQTTFVASGLFETTIDNEKKTLTVGDGFYAEPDIKHGVVCIDAGILIDVFTPQRLEFLKK